MDGKDWLRRSGDRLLVAVKAVPGSARSCVAGLRADRLLVKVAAPPDKGKANEELRATLAEALGISKSEIELVSGAASRHKTLSLPDQVEARLRQLAAGGEGSS